MGFGVGWLMHDTKEIPVDECLRLRLMNVLLDPLSPYLSTFIMTPFPECFVSVD